MGETQISWCSKTWSPVVGCTKVSPGCTNCWSLRLAWRFSHNPNPKMQAIYGGLTEQHYDVWGAPIAAPNWSGVVRCLPERLDEPLRWRKSERVFVCSQSDLFHEKVPDEFIVKVWARMAASNSIFLVLTKRPQRMLEWTRWWQTLGEMAEPWPRNVHLGVTVEDQARADERIPLLLQVPAAVHWISYEPALTPLVLRPEWLSGLRWLVAGAESGPGHRPMQESWVRDLKNQCVAASVPYFLKQSWQNGRLVHMPELDGRVWAQFPTDANAGLTVNP